MFIRGETLLTTAQAGKSLKKRSIMRDVTGFENSRGNVDWCYDQFLVSVATNTAGTKLAI